MWNVQEGQLAIERLPGYRPSKLPMPRARDRPEDPEEGRAPEAVAHGQAAGVQAKGHSRKGSMEKALEVAKCSYKLREAVEKMTNNF